MQRNIYNHLWITIKVQWVTYYFPQWKTKTVLNLKGQIYSKKRVSLHSEIKYNIFSYADFQRTHLFSLYTKMLVISPLALGSRALRILSGISAFILTVKSLRNTEMATFAASIKVPMYPSFTHLLLQLFIKVYNRFGLHCHSPMKSAMCITSQH